MAEQRYCKRLIEVDLPIKRISEHARREKSIRHGHISTLHIWWARRPLAACRAVLCASLWPDPADPLCPDKFKKEAARLMKEFRDKRGGKPRDWNNPIELREALLNFIAEFSDWDNSTNRDFLEIARSLVAGSYDVSQDGGSHKLLIVDSFAGGGAIPMEAARIGADAFALDLNPIAVLMNKTILEIIPRHGLRLSEEVVRLSDQIKKEAEKELIKFYPPDPDGAIPIAYLWARTIRCEGPGCGIEVPMLKSLWISQKSGKSVALKIITDKKHKRLDFDLFQNPKSKEIGEGTVRRGSAICPLCGYTTEVKRIRQQFREQNGGAKQARLYCVVLQKPKQTGRYYRLPNERDFNILKSASDALCLKRKKTHKKLSAVPDEALPNDGALGFRVQKYGILKWEQLFTDRQLLALTTYVEIISRSVDQSQIKEVAALLAFALGKMAQSMSSVTRWRSDVERIEGAFAMQTLQMVWDFGETNPIAEKFPTGHATLISKIIDHIHKTNIHPGTAVQGDAAKEYLPDESSAVYFSDPPYYDAISYADLSDYFYVWLKRVCVDIWPDLFKEICTPKADQAVMSPSEADDAGRVKDENYYEDKMTLAFEQARKVLMPSGIGVIVFAHKSTTGWEKLIDATIKAGWIITGSWPIDTEMASRMRAMNSAALASSIHLVCRPRENPDGSLRMNEIGDWRDVLHELPKRIHEWMPRLAQEGVVGADAIFACLGPALEIFSKYSHVEKANGEKVKLREYLEQVWGAVAKEALNMIFQGVHTEGFEEDARLTAMWLWTLSTGSNGGGEVGAKANDEEDVENSGANKTSGFSLEFDAARKIAQGLGAHLENLSSVIEVKGDQARLLPVAERVNYLFGKGSTAAIPAKKKKKENQMTLFEEFNKVEEQGWSLGDEKSAVGKTILDRLHQAMILFGAGRGDAMRRFLVEEGIGKDERFWRLAQAFSALYPSNTDEKRWVDGVLARKKSLGF
ncbi:MAG: DUF1156 domain-containing protein [Candidatus Omnitrophica bacterium]|nr:DUF1156 domain-containing protein [Pseudomonadota bacterium]MBU1863930.1 DUF1156 domain-containing protein [Candidatus Omnitrophota bacterium]